MRSVLEVNYYRYLIIYPLFLFNIAFYHHDTLDEPSSVTNEHNGIQAAVLYSLGIYKKFKIKLYVNVNVVIVLKKYFKLFSNHSERSG